ncbi:MAG: tetratricopeptide repeat protein [Terriglobia bacterium]
MEPSRIEILQQTLQSSPENSFARYALALEFSRAGQPEQALEQFQHLLAHQPEYAAAYLQAGMLLTNLGQVEEAREIFKKGVEVNRRQGNMHAQSEIEAALEGLPAEDA